MQKIEKKTVHDLKEQVDRLWKEKGEDASTSPEHLAFWQRLNRMGWERRSVGASHFNADAGALLTNEEYLRLLDEVPFGTASAQQSE